MLGRLGQTLLATGHRPYFTGKADLAKYHQLLRQGAVAQAGHNRQQHGQVGAGFQHLDPAHHIDKHILVTGLDTAVAMQHRQQHRQAILVHAYRHPARVAKAVGIHQRLDFHQQRPGAFPQNHHHTAGGRFLGTRQENRRRVFDLLEAQFGHGKHAQLINRAKAVLVAAQGAITTVAGAFQHDKGINHVLQHLGPGQAALLGHMADQKQNSVRLFGKAGQESRAFPYLADTARRRRHFRAVHHLNRVNHHDFRLCI